MKNTILTFLLLAFSLANAQSSKITTKDFNLIGKVKSVLETAEKQGDLATEKEKTSGNYFYDGAFFPITGHYQFNEMGNIVEKRNASNIDHKTIYVYDALHKLESETLFDSKLENNINKAISEVKYTHKQDTIMYTRTFLIDKEEKSTAVTQVFKNNKLTQEYTEQKEMAYVYDNAGTLIKKEFWRKKKPAEKEVANYQVTYENGRVISNFCPETNTTNTYFPNGLLKSYKTDMRFQENIYTYDQIGNWVSCTSTLDGKPSIKYFRIIEYFE